MLLTRRQPDKPTAAANKLCSIRTLNGVYTEFGIDPKILSVIAINGFIIALNRQLAKNGIGNHDSYNRYFQKMSVDFSKEGFPYTSSQYRKFSSQILRDAFGFTEEELENS